MLQPRHIAISVSLIASLVFWGSCCLIEAPAIQADVLNRCRRFLSHQHIPSDGLSVDGRDVTLAGSIGSLITSPQTQAGLSRVFGVREVKIRLLPESLEAAASATTPKLAEVQAKINAVLEKQEIMFRPESAVLTPESLPVLDEIAANLKSSPGVFVDIRGFETQTSDSHEGWVLPLRRALVIEDYLVSQGVSQWRLSTHALKRDEHSSHANNQADLEFVVRER